MSHKEQIYLLAKLKALADENRLRLCSLLAEREYNVSQLAEILQVTEPTISHHLAKLHGTGLVRLRTEGNQHFYRLNQNGIDELKRSLDQLDQWNKPEAPPSDDSWIHALPPSFTPADRELLRDLTENGKLKFLPTMRTKRYRVELVLRWLATMFGYDRTYTEREVNTIIGGVHEDFATLRRHLVDYGYLNRERNGRSYWLAPADEFPEYMPTPDLPEAKDA